MQTVAGGSAWCQSVSTGGGRKLADCQLPESLHLNFLVLAGPQHGEHYFYTTKEQFAKEIAEGRFLEYAEVHGNLYGTSVAAVRRVLDSGRVCILDIDVQGARSVRKHGLDAIFVFVAPPSLEDLARRLVGRGTETVEQIKKRLSNAKAEISR